MGYAIFGFGFSVTGDIALTYLTDCYSEVSEAINSGTTDKLTKYLRILGDVLVWVVFIRNGLSVLIMSVYTPWISSFGIQKNFHLCRNNLAGYDYYTYRATYLG